MPKPVPPYHRLPHQGFSVRTTALSHRGGVLTKKSLVNFTFGPGSLDPRTAEALAADMAKYGGKIGLRVQKGQTIKTFEVAEVKLRPDAALSREFQKTLGGAAEEKWIAFRIPSKPALLGPGFSTALTITFRAQTNSSFQLVPIVVAFGNQDLGEHFVLGLSVLKLGEPYVNSVVEIVAPERAPTVH